jgi:hypothetical protein
MVDGRCCGEPPSTTVLSWIGDTEQGEIRKKKRKVIPGQTGEEEVAREEETVLDSDGSGIEESIELMANGSLGPLDLPDNSEVIWTASGSAVGRVFLFGTVDGVNDQGNGIEVGVVSSNVPFSLNTGLQTGPKTITRYVKVKDRSGIQIAKSNSVTVKIRQPPLPIPMLFNTGQGLVSGDIDPNWSVILSADPADTVPFSAVVTTHLWGMNDSISGFITTRLMPDNTPYTPVPPGEYRFQTTFDLTGFDPSSTRIIFYVEDDNRLIDVLLNGNSTGVSGVGVDIWNSPITLDTGYISGINTLVFITQNDPVDIGELNLVGLRVKFDSFTVA